MQFTEGQPISFVINAKGGIDSKFVSALSGRRLDLITCADHNHPILAVSHGWSQFSSDLGTFLSTLETCVRERSTDTKLLTSTFRDVTYRAAELFEAYMKTFPATMPVARVKPHKLAFTAFDHDAKRHKRKWGIICNDLKHLNNTLLTASSIENSLKRPLYGFMLMAPSGVELAVRNRQVHPKDEAHHSYNVAINEIMYDLLKTDQLAADLVAKLPETTADAIVEHTQEIVSEKILSDILKLPHLRFPDQPRVFSGLQHGRGTIFYMRLLATAPATLSVSLEVKIGPMTRSYELLPKGSA